MKLAEVRQKYLDFFAKKDHVIIPSSSLIPENDPTTLFTGSGMQPLIPFLLGEKHPSGTRITNSQKCFRAEDIEEIGDNRHTTFFEMLGNWSLGDYFKREQLKWFFEFLVSCIKLDPNRLYVTVFSGDEKNGIPRDEESVVIWKSLFAAQGIEAKDVEIMTVENGGEQGMRGGRIFYYGAKKNWWSRSGIPENMPEGEPGGPDSEVFYEFDSVKHDEKFGKYCHPNCDCGRFMEIGNSVFMEYVKRSGMFEKLVQKNVDFGGGLERIVAASNNDADVFHADVFFELLRVAEKLSGKKYDDSAENRRSFRIIADHLRGSVFMISEGIVPSNTDQGYIVRRLLRRAVRFADALGIHEQSLVFLAEPLIRVYADVYSSLQMDADRIQQEIGKEEDRFRRTLRNGIKEFERVVDRGTVTGKDAFVLFSTYGFPFEMTMELAIDRGISVDREEYRKEFEQHRELSRSASKGKFKGGLADHSNISVRYHTATHLLHKALREVLGDHVEQKGSNITPERLRFDFSHGEKMTEEEKKKVETIVNEKITSALPVSYEIVPVEEARRRGAIGVFEEKYGDQVKIYQIGGAENGIFSLEFCGGPHVSNTNELEGRFKILKEESVAAGVRRIKAVIN